MKLFRRYQMGPVCANVYEALENVRRVKQYDNKDTTYQLQLSGESGVIIMRSYNVGESPSFDDLVKLAADRSEEDRPGVTYFIDPVT